MNDQAELRKKAIDTLDLLKAEILKGNIDILTIDLKSDVGYNMYNVYGHTGNQTTSFNYINKNIITNENT